MCNTTNLSQDYTVKFYFSTYTTVFCFLSQDHETEHFYVKTFRFVILPEISHVFSFVLRTIQMLHFWEQTLCASFLTMLIIKYPMKHLIMTTKIIAQILTLKDIILTKNDKEIYHRVY